MVKLALHSIAYEAKTLNLAKEGYTAFYVDGTNGLDIHDGGSWGQAFKTIQHAVDESESWTTIFIKAGTYDENVVIANDGMLLEGQSRDTVKIAPTSGTALTITGENFKADSITTVSNIFDAYSTILQGRYGRLHNVAFTSTIAGGRGAHIDASNCDLQSIYINDALTRLGVIFAAGINGSEIRDSYLKLTDSVAYAIGFSVGATNVLIHDNTIEGCWYGVSTASGVGNNTIFHNNFISVTVPIHGLNNHYFENHYSSHTTDTNNDGFCDTPFVGSVTDYTPVSKRNGWKQESLGVSVSGAGNATEAKQDTIISGQEGGVNAVNRVAGETQVKTISVTAAADAAVDTMLGIVTTQGCIIQGIVIHADAAQTVDLTSCPVYAGAAKAVTFIDAADATQANLSAENKQIGWVGEVYLPTGSTIVMVHNGAGATALDLTATIRYRSVENGGHLA